MSPAWCVAPMLLFAGLALRQEFVIRRRTRAGRAVAFYERGLARLEDRWAGEGEAGARFRSTAPTLMLTISICSAAGGFSNCSLHPGREWERKPWQAGCWIQPPCKPCANVRPPSRICATGWIYAKYLAVLGEAVGAGVHPEPLQKWAEQAPVFDPHPTRVVLALLPCLLVASVLGPPSSVLAWPRLAVVATEVILGLCFVPG